MKDKICCLILTLVLLLRVCSQRGRAILFRDLETFRKLTKIKCHCGTNCSNFPSVKCKTCKKGWYGAYCQKRNVALGGLASQKGSYTERSKNTGWKTVKFTADLAVDGMFHTEDRNNFFSKPLTCSHTNEENNAWWSVYIRSIGTNQIKYMKIYNRQKRHPGVRDRRNGMEILVNGNQCYKWGESVTSPDISKVTCYKTLTGDLVTIRVPGSELSLCEVQVFVCSDFWFGEECDQQCRCRDSTEVCDKVTGHCKSGCQEGFAGADCQQEIKLSTSSANETESQGTWSDTTVNRTMTKETDISASAAEVTSRESHSTLWNTTVTLNPALPTESLLDVGVGVGVGVGVLTLILVISMICILRRKNTTRNANYNDINRPMEMEHYYCAIGASNQDDGNNMNQPMEKDHEYKTIGTGNQMLITI